MNPYGYRLSPQFGAANISTGKAKGTTGGHKN